MIHTNVKQNNTNSHPQGCYSLQQVNEDLHYVCYVGFTKHNEMFYTILNQSKKMSVF